MNKNRCIEVKGKLICVSEIRETDYISLSDMVKNMPNSYIIIGNWLRKKDTIEFLGIWESLNNSDFKLIEFDEFKKEAGTNRFALSPQQWIEKTSAIGLVSKSGRYGGTYAHKDIAFEFSAWISPEFKLYLIKEFQRLKDQENDVNSIEWSYRRLLAATNYRVQTDAIKENLIPWSHVKQKPDAIIYAEEADLINLAVFGITAKQWREMYPEETSVCKTLRDCADTNKLIVISNLESINSMLIRQGRKDKKERFEILRGEAISQLESLYRITKDISTIESPNKKKLQKEISLQSNNEDEESSMPFSSAINKISNAGKPDK